MKKDTNSNSNNNNKKTNKKRNQSDRSPKSIGRKLMKLYENDAHASYTYNEALKAIGKAGYSKFEIVEALNYLWGKNKLDKQKGNRFTLSQVELEKRNQAPQNPPQQNSSAKSTSRKKSNTGRTVEGIVDMTSSGSAYIISDHTDKDTFVHAYKLKGALDGDRVEIKFKRYRGRPEGEVLRIIERSQTYYAGILRITKGLNFVAPDKDGLFSDIVIDNDKLGKAENGDKVIVKITEWPNGKNKKMRGTIEEVLGKPGQNDAEMLSILIENGFQLKFPARVKSDAAKLTLEIPEAEIKKRRDMRQIPTFTIDPVDAKDFDDALSVEELENGNIEIGIHIADVTHYVAPNSPMDREAYDRATSVYLVDRVLPMFPEQLSNLVCSLRPHEEKLAFSAIFEMDDNGKIYNQWFGRTVIYSDRRFTYAEAQEVIDTGKGDMADIIPRLNHIANNVLRPRRMKAGSINFDSEEVKFILDDKGHPIDVYVKTTGQSNHLIEEFMLLANRRVAQFVNEKTIGGEKIPFVNRVHASPDEAKLRNFVNLASSFGYKINTGSHQALAQSINDMLKKADGKPEMHMLSSLAIRSMAKAQYSTENIGHYGLAFEHYAHFTSPIRRYPDVMAHRILADVLNKRLPKINMQQLEVRCEHTSAMERKAVTAERQSVKYKQVEYMSDKVGDVFTGIISGVMQFGLFIELDHNKCEGLVRLESMDDDNYEYYDKKFMLRGRQTGKIYQLGNKVQVQCIATDLAARTIDFELVDEQANKKEQAN